jgi:hypothetical protein
MADPTGSAASTPKAIAPQHRVPRTTIPYYAAAFVAAAVMAWYFFLFVPDKLDYFVGLRLRTLAVASSQVESRITNLAGAVAVANARLANPKQTTDEAQYLRVLVPDVQPYSGGPLPPGIGLTVPTANKDDASAPARIGTVAWDDVMAQAAEVSTRDFDDLVLTTGNGDVLWQRERNTPRLGNLQQLVYAERAPGGWLSLSWDVQRDFPNAKPDKPLPKAVALKEIRVGITPSLLLVQAIPLPANGVQAVQNARELYLAGVVSRDALQAQAMRVPLAWIVLLSLPIVLLFLALPFVKLATLRPRERYGFADAVLLVIATIAAAGLGATIPFVPVTVDERSDQALAAFASDLDARIAEDVRTVLDLARTVTHHKDALAARLVDCKVELERFGLKKCDLWQAVHADRLARPSIELDVVIWIDADGRQLDKWTTKAQLTGEISHRSFRHFRDLITDQTWAVDRRNDNDPPYTRFTMEPLRAPTTGELGVVVAQPLERDAGGRRQFLALNVRPRSLLDTVVAPGHGFAVMELGGRVLFHSEESLSLEENFFEEVGEPADVRARALSGHTVTWSGDYHGRPHRLHMQQVSGVRNSPWRIVTFEALEPVLGGVVAHQSGTFRLAALNLLFLVLIAVGFLIYCKVKNRQMRDAIRFTKAVDASSLWPMIALAVIAAAVIVYTYRPAARYWLDGFYIFFLLLPVMGLLLAINTRKAGASPTAVTVTTPFGRALLAARLGLLVLLTAVLPAAGFARIVDRVQDSLRQERWLEETQFRVASRNANVLSRVNGVNYRDMPVLPNLPSTRDMLITRGGFADVAALDRYAYLRFLERVRVAAPDTANQTPVTSDESPEQGQTAVRFLLSWNPFPSRDTAGHPAVRLHDGALRLAPVVDGSPALAVVEPPAELLASLRPPTLYSLPWGKLALGLIILGCALYGIWWARGRLIAWRTGNSPRLAAVLREAQKTRDNVGVMLIGPPRTRKDHLVAAALRRTVRAAALTRLRLLDVAMTKEFVDATVAEVDRLVAEPNTTARARVWIHISNLEAQLVNTESRSLTLQLLERLLEKKPSQPSRVVIVTTSIDPIAHFDEIFSEEREGVYADVKPEVELSRSSLLLSRFRRCYFPLTNPSGDPWWNYDSAQWRKVLHWELSGYKALSEMEADLRRAWPAGAEVQKDDLAHAIMGRAMAAYQLLWTNCTRREKLVLIQLAQEGFVTRQSGDVLGALLAKGLIVARPAPTIFNHTFRVFLRRIERDHIVQQWERMDGNGLWVVAFRLIGSSFAAGLVFYLLTQDYSVEGLLPLLSGTGLFGVPLVRTLVARLSGRASGATATV